MATLQYSWRASSVATRKLSDTKQLKPKAILKKDIILFSQVLSSLSSVLPYKYAMDLCCTCLVLYFKHLVETVNVECISRVITL